MRPRLVRMIGAASAALAAGLTCGDETKQAEALEGALVIKSQDAVAFVPVAAETQRVAWASSPIRVDGNLSAWEASGTAPMRIGATIRPVRSAGSLAPTTASSAKPALAIRGQHSGRGSRGTAAGAVRVPLRTARLNGKGI